MVYPNGVPKSFLNLELAGLPVNLNDYDNAIRALITERGKATRPFTMLYLKVCSCGVRGIFFSYEVSGFSN